MVNEQRSKQIFNQLMNGRVINKTELNNSGDHKPNALFDEVMVNLDDYQRQYQMSGFEFVQTPSFIYIREKTENKDELKTDITMKACVLLLLIGKYITEHSYQLSKLIDKTGGLSLADFEQIEEMPETKETMQKAGMKTGLYNSVKSVLIERNILLELPTSKSFILSDAGKAFFDEVIANYSN
jgi:hypothetical protein